MRQKSRVTEWVQLCERWCEPDWVHWCDGPTDAVTRLHLPEAENVPQSLLPQGGCVTPLEAITKIALECRGSLRGRTMFVIPYLMVGGEAGVLVTDSASRAAALCRIAEVGANTLTSLESGREFAATLHLKADGYQERFIRCHLEGAAIDETACRSVAKGRIDLPLQQHRSFGRKACLDCERLCANRARAIVDDATGPARDTPCAGEV
jgi:GTP-dependent phosphoenolpyruvate carboxykinase